MCKGTSESSWAFVTDQTSNTATVEALCHSVGMEEEMRVGGSSVTEASTEHMKTSSPCGEMQALGISIGSSPHWWDQKVWAAED